jgi:hypothetical protein
MEDISYEMLLDFYSVIHRDHGAVLRGTTETAIPVSPVRTKPITIPGVCSRGLKPYWKGWPVSGPRERFLIM